MCAEEASVYKREWKTVCFINWWILLYCERKSEVEGCSIEPYMTSCRNCWWRGWIEPIYRSEGHPAGSRYCWMKEVASTLALWWIGADALWGDYRNGGKAAGSAEENPSVLLHCGKIASWIDNMVVKVHRVETYPVKTTSRWITLLALKWLRYIWTGNISMNYFWLDGPIIYHEGRDATCRWVCVMVISSSICVHDRGTASPQAHCPQKGEGGQGERE